MVVAQRPVGVHGDLGTEQAGGGALELEHVEQLSRSSATWPRSLPGEANARSVIKLRGRMPLGRACVSWWQLA
jgi:hypothetical protein